MWVYAIDGRYIEPTQVDAFTIATGSRYSILVELNRPPKTYAIRAVDAGIQIVNATAALSYKRTPSDPATQSDMVIGSSDPHIDITGAPTSSSVVFLNESAIVPYPAEVIGAETIHQTVILQIARFNNSYTWTLGNTTFPMSLEELEIPLLFNPSAITESDLRIITRNGTWVDIIITNPLLGQPPHAIHKHSNKFYVIGQGVGDWNYTSVADAMQFIPENFDLLSPQIRDTFVIEGTRAGPTWLAIRYQVVNPGAFIIHCHIQPHFSGGMAMAILDGMDAWPCPSPQCDPAKLYPKLEGVMSAWKHE